MVRARDFHATMGDGDTVLHGNRQWNAKSPTQRRLAADVMARTLSARHGSHRLPNIRDRD